MIFFDNASTTKPLKEVVEIVNDINTNRFYNPSALYRKGVELQTEINSIRKNIISLLGGNFFDNLIFTSGATEANNLAIRGVIRKGDKILVSAGEHPSIYNTAKQLNNEGYEVEFIKLTNTGSVDIVDLKNKLTNNVKLVSVMHVSNETGAINNIKEISNIVKNFNKNIILHCDGVQAFGKIPVNVTNLGVDLYTISGHKIHATKGIGALYVKNGINLKPILTGSEQEKGYRPGTENITGIFALNKASELAIKNLNQHYEYVLNLKKYFIHEIEKVNGTTVITSENSSPYIIVLSVPSIKAETLLHLLEEHEILVANGSACSSRNSINRVILEMGYSNKIAGSTIRVSFSYENTTNEIDTFVKTLQQIIEKHNKTLNIKE